MLALAAPAWLVGPAWASDPYVEVAEVRGQALGVSAEVVGVATASAGAQAVAGSVFHTDLSVLLVHCTSAGEVVGRGGDFGSIMTAFLASPSHWNVITSTGWTSMGAGQVAGADGLLYVSMVFCEAPGSYSAPVLKQGALPPGDTIGQQDPLKGQWSLAGPSGVSSFYFGNPGDVPVTCDWDGDGLDTVGQYRPSNGFLYMRNSNTQGMAEIQIFFGNPSDQPVCGDWNGDGVDTIGIYRTSTQTFHLRNSNTQGMADLSFVFGNPGDRPFAGDWDGDGWDTVGLYRPSTGRVYITNHNQTGVAEFDGYFGNPGDRFVVGDWDQDGRDSFGIFRPLEATFYLSNQIGNGTADLVISFGSINSRPVAGEW
jgi:hypothetical protein